MATFIKKERFVDQKFHFNGQQLRIRFHHTLMAVPGGLKEICEERQSGVRKLQIISHGVIMYQLRASQLTTSTPRANKVDTTKIDRLSERIAASDAEIIGLRSAFRNVKLSISRGHAWKAVERSESKRKRVKVVLTETMCRDMRVELERLRYALTLAKYERMSLRSEHQALSIRARLQTSLYRETLVLSRRAGRNSDLFLSMLESRLKAVSPDDKTALDTLNERYKSEPAEAKKELMRVVKESHKGYYLALNEHPSLKTKFFKQFFEGSAPVSQDAQA